VTGPVTVGEVLRLATEYLAGKGVESPRLDAEHLLGKALGLSRVELYMQHDRPLSGPERDVFRELTRRRGEREPLAYLLGEWGFRRLTLTTDRRALVPRPETEVLVERCLALLDGRPNPRVLDVGTGTGAIALAIADEHPGARVTAIDVSPDALALARENIARTGIGVDLVEQDLTGGLGEAEYDLVVSNPPYVTKEEWEVLQPEVKVWEPRLAIVGEDHTDEIADHARDALRPGGHLALEVADLRANDVAALLERCGYEDVLVTEDLAGRDRIVEGRRP
jgi:release factor glutamine methyltransferase